MKYIDIHTHFKTSNDSEQVFQLDYSNTESVFQYFDAFSIGIHPWDILTINYNSSIDLIRSIVDKKQVPFIGEIGLDRACNVPLDIQKKVFISQLEIAIEHKIPVIIHCVKAYADILEILKEKKVQIPIIFHGFNGNEQLIRQLSQYNSYFSFGFKIIKSEKMQTALTHIPMNRLFFETDTKEQNIEEIYVFAQKILGVSRHTLQELIYKNFCRLTNKAE